MPSSESILAGLTKAANDWQWLATVFHLYFGFLIILVVIGVRIGKRLAGILLAIPLASVSVLAWMSMNPFNGFLFAIVAVVLIVLSIRIPSAQVHLAPLPVAIAGFLLLAFGWIYPHFLNTSSFLPYLYSAPVGIVPCPTLSVVIGAALILGSFESRAWGIVSAAAGIFYGLFGTLRLGVALDWFLVAGAAALLAYCLIGWREPAKTAARG
jgi:hypothetical protein